MCFQFLGGWFYGWRRWYNHGWTWTHFILRRLRISWSSEKQRVALIGRVFAVPLRIRNYFILLTHGKCAPKFRWTFGKIHLFWKTPEPPEYISNYNIDQPTNQPTPNGKHSCLYLFHIENNEGSWKELSNFCGKKKLHCWISIFNDQICLSNRTNHGVRIIDLWSTRCKSWYLFRHTRVGMLLLYWSAVWYWYVPMYYKNDCWSWMDELFFSWLLLFFSWFYWWVCFYHVIVILSQGAHANESAPVQWRIDDGRTNFEARRSSCVLEGCRPDGMGDGRRKRHGFWRQRSTQTSISRSRSSQWWTAVVSASLSNGIHHWVLFRAGTVTERSNQSKITSCGGEKCDGQRNHAKNDTKTGIHEFLLWTRFATCPGFLLLRGLFRWVRTFMLFISNIRAIHARGIEFLYQWRLSGNVWLDLCHAIWRAQNKCASELWNESRGQLYPRTLPHSPRTRNFGIIQRVGPDTCSRYVYCENW